MAPYINSMQSCALNEIHDLPDSGKYPTPVDVILDMFADSDDDDWTPFYIFKQSLIPGGKTLGWGSKFAAYIQKQGLGVVTTSKAMLSKHNRKVTVFVWAVNAKALTKWLDKQREP